MSHSFFMPRVVAGSAAIFAVCVGVSYAQIPPPATPAPPTAPPATDPTAPDTARAQAAYQQALEAMTKAQATMNKEFGANGPFVRGLTLGTAGFENSLQMTRLPAQTISLNLKNTSARDAIVKILSDAKLDYVIDDDFPKDSHVTLSLSDVQLSTSLDLVTQSAGVKWVAEKRDKKTIVHVGKSVIGNNLFGSLNNAFSLSFSNDPVTGKAERTHFSIGPPAPVLKWNGIQLPSTKLSMDLRDASARDTLVSILEKQKLDYEIADDFPKDAKISLSVQDAELSTVVGMITRSVGYRWVAEKRGDKIVVRVGKNVVPNSFYYLYGGENGKSGSVLPAPAAGANGLGVDMLRIDKSSNGSPVIYQYQTSEQRSTFTCPRCGKKTTIVQKSVGVGKPGTKTDEHDDWHYCPYCGKKVSDQNAHLVQPWDESDDTTAGIGAIQLPALPDFPAFDTAFPGAPVFFELH